MPSQLSQKEVKIKININISNIVAKSQLVPPFSLSSLTSQYPFDPQAVLSRIYIPHNHTKFSIFRTGTVISRASRSLNDLEASFSWLRAFLFNFDLKLSHHYQVINIVAFSQLVSSPLNLHNLASHLPNCSYDPSFLDGEHARLVDCITYYFHQGRPRFTALIFPTGKVTFTGFQSTSDLEAHALKLSSLLSQISQNYPDVLGPSLKFHKPHFSPFYSYPDKIKRKRNKPIKKPGDFEK